MRHDKKKVDVNVERYMSPEKVIKVIPRKSIVHKRTNEKYVSEFKKLRTFIKSVVGRKITVLSKIEYDQVRTEYGEIINACEISNSAGVIDDVWNEYNHQKVTD